MPITQFKTQKDLKIVFMGGWYGTLLVPLAKKTFKNFKEMTLIDYDEETIEIAKYVHRKEKAHILN